MLNERLKDEVQRERVALRAELDAERDRCLVLATSESSLRAQLDSSASKLKKAESDNNELKDKVVTADSLRANVAADLKVTQAKIQAQDQRISQ